MRAQNRCIVIVYGAGELPPRNDLRNHSPSGFEWGYGGSGPAQLALALCAHVLGNDTLALQVYQQFKFKVVGNLAPKWILREEEIRASIEEIRKENLPALTP